MSPSYMNQLFLDAVDTTTFTLNNATFVSAQNFTIGMGIFIGSGVIETPNFYFDSLNGSFTVGTPNKLTLIGNMKFTARSTVYLNLKPNGLSDLLNVTGNFDVAALMILNLDTGYSPAVDDLIPFLNLGGSATFATPQSIALFGAVQRCTILFHRENWCDADHFNCG
jgi:hypothetical protein